MQEYYNNCSIAITSKELVSLAIEFFANNLIKTKSEPEVKIEEAKSDSEEKPVEEKKKKGLFRRK